MATWSMRLEISLPFLDLWHKWFCAQSQYKLSKKFAPYHWTKPNLSQNYKNKHDTTKRSNNPNIIKVQTQQTIVFVDHLLKPPI